MEKNNSVCSLNLNLQQRASLDRGICFGADKLMLSVDEEVVKVQQTQPPPEVPAEHDILRQIEHDDAQYLVEVLGLNEVRPSTETEQRSGKTAEDTKNILRNFGNAQNQYVLYNERAQESIRRRLSDPGRFHKWVRRLRLQNFQQFKRVWQGEGHPTVYRNLYRQLCWKFYSEEAACYVMSSRMKNESTRSTHLKYIYRFLEGLVNPDNFYYFKKQV